MKQHLYANSSLVVQFESANNYHFKADRTPGKAGMKLLAIPFRPNAFESMYLSQHKVLGDQMVCWEKQFSGNRIWKAA